MRLFALLGTIAVTFGPPIHFLCADARSTQPIEREQYSNPRPVPELPKRDQKLFLKMAKLMKTDREAALKLLLNSLSHKNSAALYFMAGDLLQQNGYTLDALEYFRVAIEKYPDFYIALRSAGVIETHLKNFEVAQQFLLRAYGLTDRPDHVVAGSLGVCFLGLGDFENAALYYREAIKLNANYRSWKKGLAEALHGQAKHEEANAIMESLKTDEGTK